MRFKIPASIDDATQELVSIDGLMLATEWKRAAIVAAFVTLDGKPGPKSNSASSSRSPAEFAALGIAGLRSKDTVRRYVDAWGDRPKPRPGATVTLPTEPFPVVKTKAQDIAQQPGAIAKSFDDEAQVAKIAARLSPKAKRNLAAAVVDQQTLDDPTVKMKVRGQVAQHDDTARRSSSGDSPLTGAVKDAINALHNEHLYKSFTEFKAYKAQLDSGDWTLNDSDASIIDRFLVVMAEVAANVTFEEVK